MTSLAELSKQKPTATPPSFSHYEAYTRALALQSQPPTGFMEFQVRDPTTQAKYDAMSPAWEGIESTDAAIARGDYALETAEKTRQDLRSGRPTPAPAAPQPVETSWNCSIQ